MTGPWTRDEASASGQVFEFRVWAALSEQSRGSLHVFLPLTDRGVDGLVHRRWRAGADDDGGTRGASSSGWRRCRTPAGGLVTGNNSPFHYTVTFPGPVDVNLAGIFNRLFYGSAL